MAHDATLHVKIDPATNEQLARLAAARKTSKGQLVRDAIFSCYQVPVNDLPIRQPHALRRSREVSSASGSWPNRSACTSSVSGAGSRSTALTSTLRCRLTII